MHLSMTSSLCVIERVQHALQIHYILRPFPIYVTINQEIHLFKVTYEELITDNLNSFFKNYITLL